MGRERYLIANTTRKEREQIVKDALEYSEVGCEGCGAALGYDMYQPYIDGEMEISEVTQNFHRNYVKADNSRERHGCGMGR